MKKIIKAWGVTNLGGKAFIWDAYIDAKNRMPFFPSKKGAIAEKIRLDKEKPSPNEKLFERKIIPVEINFTN